MLKRIVSVAAIGLGVLHSVLLTVFVGLAAMVLAAWLGARWEAILGAGVLGLICGAVLSKRVWFKKPPPAAEPALREWRLPGVQDEFDRLHARQRVLAVLLVSALLVLLGLRFVPERNWPARLGMPRERLLVGVLVAVVIVVPLGLLNWRCPHCRRNLGGRLSLRQCPHCGIVLRG